MAWEEGDNRSLEGMLPPEQTAVPDGTVLVVYGESLRVKEDAWRVAGVCVPVFSLRSSRSCGVGDFGDLRLLVDQLEGFLLVGLHQLREMGEKVGSHSREEQSDVLGGDDACCLVKANVLDASVIGDEDGQGVGRQGSQE